MLIPKWAFRLQARIPTARKRSPANSWFARHSSCLVCANPTTIGQTERSTLRNWLQTKLFLDGLLHFGCTVEFVDASIEQQLKTSMISESYELSVTRQPVCRKLHWPSEGKPQFERYVTSTRSFVDTRVFRLHNNPLFCIMKAVSRT